MKYLTQLLDLPYQIFKTIEGVDVYHYEKPAAKQAPYAIWKEEGDESFNSDNQKSERGLQGILDYYTLDDMDPALDELEKAMEKMGASWQLTSSQIEENTHLKHYSWDWTVI